MTGEMTTSFPNHSNLVPKSCDSLNQPIRSLHLFKSLRIFQNFREFVRFHQKFHPHLKSKAVGTALLKSKENKEYTAAIFLDLSKAFDMLEHKIY